MRATLVAGALVLAPALASAQTSDALWRSWQALDDVTEARAAGLGGAVVAVADDAATVRYNPAGLTRLPGHEAAASVIYRGEGTRPNHDQLGAATRLGSLAGSLLVSDRWAVGGFVAQSAHQHISLTNAGALEMDTVDAGGAVAWHPAERLHLGVRLVVRHLRLSGAATQDGLTVGTASNADELAGDAGILMELTPQLWGAISYRRGVRWSEIERTAVTIEGVTVDAGSAYQLALPSVAAAGLAWRPSPRWIVAAQLDYVALSEVDDTIGTASPQDYRLEDTFEPRLGAEYSLPLDGSLTVQFRAGVHYRASRAFEYAGAAADIRAEWPGDDSTVVGSGGASVVTRAGHRLDVAAVFGGGRTALLAGAAVRF